MYDDDGNRDVYNEYYERKEEAYVRAWDMSLAQAQDYIGLVNRDNHIKVQEIVDFIANDMIVKSMTNTWMSDNE
tara:strand:+ start:6151 stop:6372 length:222 start_codon:yes stop_codon:yes gene_type:complete